MSAQGDEDGRSCVLDASALLAMLHAEPGGQVVEDLLATAVMSSVNWSEVVQKALERKVDVDGLRQDLEALGLEILPFLAEHAEGAAHLRKKTQHAGLSLGDRSCLALATALDLPAVTADKVWREVEADTGVEIRVVR